jgi:CSLREA domain-containing protein
MILISLVVLPSGHVSSSPSLSPASAIIDVTTFVDDFNSDLGSCSLREAVYTAIHNGDFGGCVHTGDWGYDTITLEYGTYELTLMGIEDAGLAGDLDIYPPGSGATSRSIQSPSGPAPDITIQGEPTSFSIIDANSIDRVFQIHSGISVRLQNLRMQNGYTNVSDPSGGGIYNGGSLTLDYASIVFSTAGLAGDGGGIYNHGELTLVTVGIFSNTTVDSSTATDVGDGGGIYNEGTIFANDSSLIGNITGNSTGAGEAGAGAGIYNAAVGNITLNRVSVYMNLCGQTNANHGVDGGGIFNEGTLTMNTSTISTNRAGSVLPGSGDYYGGSGGGIANMTTGTITITDSTIAKNAAGGSSGSGTSAAGGLLNSGGSVIMGNSILADNTAGYDRDCSGSILSAGHNLIEFVSSCSINGDTTGNITGQDPKLASIDTYYSLNFVHRLLFGSPAIDAGPTSCIYIDQRHLSRPQDGDGDGTATCDIGAYEAYLWQFMPIMVMP